MKNGAKSKTVYPYVILWILLVFPLTLFYAHLVGSYWAYWDMGTDGGNAFGLLLVIPLMLFLFFGVGSITSLIAWIREYDGWRVFLLSVANMAITFVISFAFEVFHSSDYPTFRTGSLFDFLIQYFKRWI